ncbi:MAG TPA: hypothetical protein PLD25_28180 [Chloroflexota bacterium]|nr:hypothetical protein [Chloroflexota bacterium]
MLESYDIPEEYKDIFLIAQEKRSSKITVIEPINGGRSGAYLFAISELTNDGRAENLQHCILKLYQRKSTEKDEYENLRIAHSKEPEFGKKHIATLNGYPIESKGRTAVFYNIAGNSLQQCRPMSSYVDSPKSLKAIFSKISNSILEEWNVQLRFSRLTYPQQFLKEWLGYRIKPGQGNIAKFLEENFKVNSNEPGLIIDGIVVPNPFAYACEQGLWGDVEKIDPARGYLHGDLNINNILVSFTRDGELKEYQLIDFAKFEVESFLFYDHLYLEMSYLVELIANAKVPFEQWKKLIFILAQEDMPDPEKVPTNMMGACVALVSSRHMFDDWLNSKHPNLRDHFWGQFRLAAVAAGLNFCNKTELSPKERWAAFVYAAAHLKRYCDLFDVVKPNQAIELILADDDLSIDPGQDWQPFLEACHNFDNEHLFILVVGPEANPDKSLAPLGRIGWSVVIDFDQDTQTNGVYKAISSEGSKHRSLHIVTREDQNELALNPVYGTYWYAAHGLAGRANTLPTDNTYRKWSQTYTSVFRRFLANFAATSQELPITVVVTWDAVQFISKVCELFDEIFIDRVEFVFASYTGESLRNVANLYNATIFRLNLHQIAAGVSSVIGPNSNNDQAAILLPSHVQGNKDAQVEIPRETANWLHEELTLVHLNLGLFQESDYEPGYNFLRGNIISWFELGLDIDIKRDKTESLERQVRFDLENGNISRINLYHYPGAGGSTIARRIAWNFHKKFPTILINQISLLGTIERLSSLYKFVDKPILAIVEHTGFQKETLDTLFASVRARTLPIVFLVVSRKLDSMTETERIKYLPELLIEREPERFARVYSKEALLGRASKVNDLASNQAMRKLRTPFYFGLTAFEEKFLQLPTYVAARLEGMTNLERKIMCYLALTHYYTQILYRTPMFV